MAEIQIHDMASIVVVMVSISAGVIAIGWLATAFIAVVEFLRQCEWRRSERATAPGYPGNLRRIGQ